MSFDVIEGFAFKVLDALDLDLKRCYTIYNLTYHQCYY